jgi:hypothetical protein
MAVAARVVTGKVTAVAEAATAAVYVADVEFRLVAVKEATVGRTPTGVKLPLLPVKITFAVAPERTTEPAVWVGAKAGGVYVPIVGTENDWAGVWN